MKSLTKRVKKHGVLPVKQDQAEEQSSEFSAENKRVTLCFPEEFYAHILHFAHQQDVSVSRLVRASLRLALPVFESNPSVLNIFDQKHEQKQQENE